LPANSGTVAFRPRRFGKVPSARTAVCKATEALNDYWFNELQPRLAALSTRGHLVIDEHAEKPPAVLDAVRQVVTEIRSGQ
jgi:hypothetical protein